MANEKVLILKAPWPDDIGDTQATHGIHASATTLLRVGTNPVRITRHPLISSTYVQDHLGAINREHKIAHSRMQQPNRQRM